MRNQRNQQKTKDGMSIGMEGGKKQVVDQLNYEAEKQQNNDSIVRIQRY
jgi:hypothetical protein